MEIFKTFFKLYIKKKMTIKIKLSGGLGNQMFQFATGYTVAKKKKCKA